MEVDQQQRLVESVIDGANLRIVELGTDSIRFVFQDGGSVVIGVDPNLLELVVVE